MSDDYEVGYGKPPKHTQFKPGQSGNISGRPKRKEPEQPHDPSGILTQPLTVRTKDGPTEMSALEVGLRKLVQEALKTTSSAKLIKVIERLDKAGLVQRPKEIKHISVLRIPKRFQGQDYIAMIQEKGPPPWDGPDDGLPMDQSQTHPLSEYRRLHGREE